MNTLGTAVDGLVQTSETQDAILHEHQEHLVENDRKHRATDKKTATLTTLVSVFGIVLLAVVAVLVYDRADSLKSLLSSFFKHM